MSQRKMHLMGLLCAGPTNHHQGAWRHPDSDVDQLFEIERYERLAQLYEQGLFDGVFFIDFHILPGLPDGDTAWLKHGGALAMMEPMHLLVSMARATRHLGLSATMSTTLTSAYSIARQFGTLDLLSGGRAGWNVVTSFLDADARLHGLDRLPHKEARYDRADEVVELCLQLWDTWSPDALVADRESGVFADPHKIRYTQYRGDFVRLDGALGVPHTPQGHPVLMQAGASARGKEFAAKWAEVIFSPHSVESTMRSFYSDVKATMKEGFGRAPDECVVLPSVDIVAGESDAEAEEYAAQLDALANPLAGVRTVANSLQADLTGLPLDTPLSQIPAKDAEASNEGARQRFVALAGPTGGRDLTIREAAMLQTTTNVTPRFVGSASTVADQMQALFEDGCADGFIVTHALSPDGLERFVKHVVPELQRRGLYRTEYRGATFRENLRDNS